MVHAVVPDHEVADLPFVTVDELGLRRKCDQLVHQRPPLLGRHPDDVRCERGNIERGAPGAGMSAQHWMSGRRVRPYVLARSACSRPPWRMRAIANAPRSGFQVSSSSHPASRRVVTKSG
jgi:hypothetical protein